MKSDFLFLLPGVVVAFGGVAFFGWLGFAGYMERDIAGIVAVGMFALGAKINLREREER